MKKFLSMVLTLAMLVSAAAMVACSDDGEATSNKGGSNNPSGGTSPKTTTAAKPGQTTSAKEQTTAQPSQEDIDYDNLLKLYRRFEDAQVTNVEAFLQEAANKNLMLGTSASGAVGLELFDSFNEELSIYVAMNDKEAAPNLFDADSFQTEEENPENPSTKWCGGSTDNEYNCAIVWSMTGPVNVTGYSITTGNDNGKYTERGPITWRLYGCNGDIPTAKMSDVMPGEDELTYFARYMVPEGWELVDAIDAMSDGDQMKSIFPDENFAEIFVKLDKPVQYQHFMFVLDTNESDCIQMSSFNLYGTKAE